MLPNGLDFPLAWLAVPMLRAVAVPVNAGYGPADLGHVLRDSGAVHALVGREQLPVVSEVRERGAAPALRRVQALRDLELSPPAEGAPAGARGGAEPGPGSASPEPDAEVAAGPSEPVTIQYTSGTTGRPRGCILDHGYWLGLARTMQGFLGLGPDDVLATAQPQSYMDPSWNLVLALVAGAPLVVFPRFSASRFWRDVGREGVTFFYCIGTMPLYLLRQPSDPSVDRGHRVRLVYCSGIPPALHAAFEERWGCPWRETYGSTELGVVLLVPPEDEASVGTGSMGPPVPGRRVQVVREGGAPAEPGEAGELQVRGGPTMQGYHGDPEATEAWRRDGWCRTGDLVEPIGDGYRHVGRKKDMIRRAGENIAAAEVEAVLAEHPAVRAAACIPVPDPLRGQEVKAYVQLAEGAVAAGPDAAALRAFVLERLARFKAPRYVEFVDAFPLTASQKIARGELMDSREDHVEGSWDAEAGEDGT